MWLGDIGGWTAGIPSAAAAAAARSGQEMKNQKLVGLLRWPTAPTAPGPGRPRREVDDVFALKLSLMRTQNLRLRRFAC